MTPLHLAIEEGNYVFVQEFLDMGADISLKPAPLVNSPLALAIVLNNPDTYNQLIHLPEADISDDMHILFSIIQ